MEWFRQYAFTVVGGALVCGVVLGMAPKGAARDLIKLLCGLFLTVIILSPVASRNWDAVAENIFSQSEDEALEAAAIGENHARNLLGECIKKETEEYILDKAAAMDVSLTAEVTVEGEDIPVPVSVILSGEAEPAVRKRLEQIISDDLGISKENQLWTEGNFVKN